MDGLQNMASSPVPLSLDGQEYQLSALTLAALGEVEREVCRRRISPLDALADCIDRFDSDQQSRLIDRAVVETARLSRSATRGEVSELLGSFDGICFFFYLAVRGNHPAIDSPKAACELLSGIGPVDLARLSESLARAAGLEALGKTAKNLPTREVENEQTQPGDVTSRSPGSDSTSS